MTARGGVLDLGEKDRGEASVSAVSVVRMLRDLVYDDDEERTLTYPPAIPENRLTRIRLGFIPQEPFRVELQRIDVSVWIVQNLPTHRVRWPMEDGLRENPPDIYNHRNSLGD